MLESTKEYYERKSEKISDLFDKKIKDNEENYQGFVNTPFSKNMIRLKFEYRNEDVYNITDDDVLDVLVEESLDSLIYSSFTNQDIEKDLELELLLNDQDKSGSTINIKDYLDYVIDFKHDNYIDETINKIKNMYIGDKIIPFLPYLLDDVNGQNIYLGDYRSIKLFYIRNLEDVYLTSDSFIDLNTIDVRYNEYILEDYHTDYNEDSKYEEIEDYKKMGVLTLNCSLGDVKIIKLKAIFNQANQYLRKKKLERILKKNIQRDKKVTETFLKK